MTAQMVCRTQDIPAPGVRRYETDAGPVAVVHAEDDTWYALADWCTHQKVPLSQGEVVGCTIECVAHGAAFDLVTGRPQGLPAVDRVTTYPVTIDGESVLVDVENPQWFDDHPTVTVAPPDVRDHEQTP